MNKNRPITICTIAIITLIGAIFHLSWQLNKNQKSIKILQDQMNIQYKINSNLIDTIRQHNHKYA